MRADTFSWTYGDNTTNVPEIEVTSSWGDDWSGFAALTDRTDVTVNAKKTDANTVVFTITFASDANAKETYTLKYAQGVPSDLKFQIGADGGKVTLKSATFPKAAGSTDETTVVAGSTDETTVAAGSTETTTVAAKTGDGVSTTAMVILAAVACGAVVLSKKNRVTE